MELICDESEALIQAAKGGAPWAWNQIVNLHQGFVFSMIRKRGVPPAEAEDVMQEVFLRVYKYLKTFEQHSSFRTWVGRITINSVLDWRASAAKHSSRMVLESQLDPPQASPGGFMDSQPDLPFDPSGSLGQERHLAEVRQTLYSLPDMDREILILRELEELSYREIADRLSVEIGTVKSRLSRARQALVQAMLRKGWVNP